MRGLDADCVNQTALAVTVLPRLIPSFYHHCLIIAEPSVCKTALLPPGDLKDKHGPGQQMCQERLRAHS